MEYILIVLVVINLFLLQEISELKNQIGWLKRKQLRYKAELIEKR